MTAAAAPAIGYSIVANLGGDRQMTVQCFVGEDEADSVVHERIDRVFRVVDRQKAKYELVDFRKELDSNRKQLAQMQADVSRLDVDHAKAQAELDVQITETADQKRDAIADAAEKHRASGRQGNFSPGGNVTSRFDTVTAQLKAAKDKNDAERNVALAQYEVNLKRWQEEIARVEGLIAEREELVKG